MTEKRFWPQLRVALWAVALVAVCQILIETVAIATRYRSFIISPHEFGRNQMYDFSVKLFVLLPRAAEWLQGGTLDRFVSDGFGAKLVLPVGLVVPNLVIGSALALLVAAGCAALRRSPSITRALWALVALGAVVHVTSYLVAVHVPKAWTVRTLLRNSGRVFLFDGTWIAVLTLAAAAALAAVIVPLPRVRRGVLGVAATAAIAAILMVVPVRPASSAPTAGGIPAAATTSAVHVDNLVLISIDSLRADRLGCYGQRHDTSPNIDRLAREGVRFANVTSTTSWTLPSHMSLLTGRYVLSHGVITQTDGLSPRVPTLAEAVRAAGLTTGGVVATLFLQPRYGFGRGFDYYDDSNVARTWYDELTAETAPGVTRQAINWLRQQQNRRFFLFLHFWDVHYDYIPPPPYDQMFDPGYRGSVDGRNFMHNPAVKRGMPERDLQHLLALYDGEIRWVDDHIGTVMATLSEMGVADRTAVIVTGDHGDEFFEHGGKGHQRTLYREVVQVPLVMRIPGVAAGQVVQMPVSLVDVMPTVLELVGARAPAGLEGVSLVPELAGHAGDARRSVYGWLCNPQRTTDCEAMEHSGVDTLLHLFQPARVELYAAADVAERVNLAHGAGWPRHERLAALADQLNAQWHAFRGIAGRSGQVNLDRATQERLRALGYAD
jgi:arylsulfatase A-like enzyme